MSTPKLEAKLPELMTFARHLASDHQNHTVTDGDAFKQRCLAFYTPAMMDKINPVVMGWKHMASYLDQQTLIHVTSVLVALFQLPEYQTASADHKVIMEWMVMFHDVAKRAEHNKHDYIHAFRSAAITGPALAQIGFSTRPNFADHVSAWKTLTEDAVIYTPAHGEYIQDNSKLPEIVSGIDDLYGQNSDAALVIKGVLFHLSISSDPGYPIVAPLTRSETQQYIDRALFPILKAMMLVDCDAWYLFDPPEKQRLHQLTLDVFDDIAQMNAIV